MSSTQAAGCRSPSGNTENRVAIWVDMSRVQDMGEEEFVDRAVALIHQHWGKDGPPRGVLVNHLGGQRNVRAQGPIGGPDLQSSSCGH